LVPCFGSGGAVGLSDIVSNQSVYALSAVSFQNVNQTTVFANPLTTNGSGTTSSLSVPTSDVNNLVIDVIALSALDVLTATHTLIGSGSPYGMGSAQGTGGNVVVQWNFPLKDYSHSAIELICDSCPVPNSAPNIPTLSEWGLLNLALLLMICGTLYLVQPLPTSIVKLEE